MVSSLQQELEDLCPPSCRQDLCSPACSLKHVRSPCSWQCWLEYADDFTPLGHQEHLKVSLVCLKPCKLAAQLSQGTRKHCSSRSLNSQNSLDYHVYVLSGQCREEKKMQDSSGKSLSEKDTGIAYQTSLRSWERDTPQGQDFYKAADREKSRKGGEALVPLSGAK